MQSYTNVEHIVVDGGSADETLNVLQEYQKKDSRLTFSSGPDGGQGDAVNKGFAQASGDIIAWINSDDYFFDDEVFQYVVDFFNENPGIDIIYGGMAYVDSGDNLFHIRIPPQYDYSVLTRISYIGNTNAFYRRKVIERHVLDTSYHFVIDHEFMLRITKDFNAYRTKRMIGCFRVHPEAKTQTLSVESKDVERLRRDQFHSITTGLTYNLLQYRDRFIYRLSLFYTDWKYMPAWKISAPYRKFIK